MGADSEQDQEVLAGDSRQSEQRDRMQSEDDHARDGTLAHHGGELAPTERMVGRPMHAERSRAAERFGWKAIRR